MQLVKLDERTNEQEIINETKKNLLFLSSMACKYK